MVEICKKHTCVFQIQPSIKGEMIMKKLFVVIAAVLFFLAFGVKTTDGKYFFPWQWDQAKTHACKLAGGEYIDGGCVVLESIEMNRCFSFTSDMGPDGLVHESSRGICYTFFDEVSFGLGTDEAVSVSSTVDLSLDIENPDCWFSARYHYCTEVTPDSLIVTIHPR